VQRAYCTDFFNGEAQEAVARKEGKAVGIFIL
jgi:hypothetical protein